MIERAYSDNLMRLPPWVLGDNGRDQGLSADSNPRTDGLDEIHNTIDLFSKACYKCGAS